MSALLQTAHKLGIELIDSDPSGKWVTFLDRWGGYVRIEESEDAPKRYHVSAERLHSHLSLRFASADEAIQIGHGDYVREE
ncbi:MAG: hypothetical protein M1319_03300 [Chloroflexi bacterium]|nr:hypothetical protein [Chloroflexota bacterium]